MKQYPSIHKTYKGNKTKFWVFDKLDGSNIRAEWSKKKGFYKFGTRKRLLGADQGILLKAHELAHAKEKLFKSLFTQSKIDRVVCFFEFWGHKSFAGSHAADDEHFLTLIDVDVYKEGLMPPAVFLNTFRDSEIDIPNFIHYGPVDQEFCKLVKESKIDGVTFEGVVAKTYNKRKKDVDMFKIKSNAWLSIVKEKYGNDPQKLKELI